MNRNIIINDKVINYNLTFKNKKNLSIKLDSNGELIVYAPIGMTIKYIEKILLSKEKWIITNINKIENSNINNNNTIYFLGRKFNSKIELSECDYIYLDGDVIFIKTKNLEISYIERLLSNWYKVQANVIIKERVKELSKKYCLFPSKLIIKNQKTRWGSCNSNKEIRLNWRLILMPYYVMDYIITHELCHLKHMNHSKDFWNLIDNYIRNYKEAEKWLKENGINIMKIN